MSKHRSPSWPIPIPALDAFEVYLDSRGIGRRPGRGDFQVLQVEHDGHWLGVYSRQPSETDPNARYLGSDARLGPLVTQFLKDPERVEDALGILIDRGQVGEESVVEAVSAVAYALGVFDGELWCAYEDVLNGRRQAPANLQEVASIPLGPRM